MASRYRRYWYVGENGLAIVEESAGGRTVNYTTEQLVSITESGLEIRVHAIVLDKSSKYDNLVDVPNIPVQFHEFLFQKAISTLYEDERNRDFQAAQYFNQKYQEGVKEGKKYARRGHQRGGVVRPYDM